MNIREHLCRGHPRHLVDAGLATHRSSSVVDPSRWIDGSDASDADPVIRAWSAGGEPSHIHQAIIWSGPRASRDAGTSRSPDTRPELPYLRFERGGTEPTNGVQDSDGEAPPIVDRSCPIRHCGSLNAALPESYRPARFIHASASSSIGSIGYISLSPSGYVVRRPTSGTISSRTPLIPVWSSNPLI